MQSLITALIDSVAAIPDAFAAVVRAGPVELVLVLVGALFVAASTAVLGYLTLGAVVDLVTPEVSGRAPPRAGR